MLSNIPQTVLALNIFFFPKIYYLIQNLTDIIIVIYSRMGYILQLFYNREVTYFPPFCILIPYRLYSYMIHKMGI